MHKTLLLGTLMLLAPAAAVSHPCEAKVVAAQKDFAETRAGERQRQEQEVQLIMTGMGNADATIRAMAEARLRLYEMSVRRLTYEVQRIDALIDRCDELKWAEQKAAPARSPPQQKNSPK